MTPAIKSLNSEELDSLHNKMLHAGEKYTQYNFMNGAHEEITVGTYYIELIEVYLMLLNKHELSAGTTL